jgi:hypothetical protein
MQGLICLRTAPSLVVESAVHCQRVHCSGVCNYFHSPTSGHYVGHQFNALLTYATQGILSKRSLVSQACSSLEEKIILLRTSSQRDVAAVSGAAVIPLSVSPSTLQGPSRRRCAAASIALAPGSIPRHQRRHPKPCPPTPSHPPGPRDRGLRMFENLNSRQWIRFGLR